MKKIIEDVILTEKVTKWALYVSINTLNFIVAVGEWNLAAYAGTLLAFLTAWKAFMSNPNGNKEDDSK